MKRLKTLIALNEKPQIIEEQTPQLFSTAVKVKTHFSAISPGTERLIIAGSVGERRNLGYSAVGQVIEVGKDVVDLKVGDLVACYGGPYVHHATELVVPAILTAKIESSQPLIHYAFAAHGTIAIHAIRQAKLQFGESVIIIGLGVLGQMIAKICVAAAYDVYCYEPNEERATQFQQTITAHVFSDLREMERFIEHSTQMQGVDAVLLCAGGKYSETTNNSLKWVRKQGTIVIVGDVEPHFDRELMFGKEATITISRAGGPGRYDVQYEKMGCDYPYSYVRWTEGRNIKEFVRLVNNGLIDMSNFIQHIVPFHKSATIYDELQQNPQYLTAILSYEEEV